MTTIDLEVSTATATAGGHTGKRKVQHDVQHDVEHGTPAKSSKSDPSTDQLEDLRQIGALAIRMWKHIDDYVRKYDYEKRVK